MRQIKHWTGSGLIEVAESAGRVLATLDPLANLVRAGIRLWPTPELLQKLYASGKWRGKTEEDGQAVRRCPGHYCDLQSLNSEDAITWSFFGPLIYGPPEWRDEFARRAFEALSLPRPQSVTIWLWRRIPHPEKPESTGGPEIDFGLQSETCAVLGEAKWNSMLGKGQGLAGNRSQLDLRLAFCSSLGLRGLPAVRHWVILGVGRKPDVLEAPSTGNTIVRNASWRDLVQFMPSPLRPEVEKYVIWKEQHSSPLHNSNTGQRGI